jgi:hypothetical protein
MRPGNPTGAGAIAWCSRVGEMQRVTDDCLARHYSAATPILAHCIGHGMAKRDALAGDRCRGQPTTRSLPGLGASSTVLAVKSATQHDGRKLGPDARFLRRGDELGQQVGTNAAPPPMHVAYRLVATTDDPITQDRDNAQIAARLGVTEKIVRNHLTSIFAKLEVENRGHAIVLARKTGFGEQPG